MINTITFKILLSFLIFISFFLGKEIAGFSIIVGSAFIIHELIQKKIESIGIFFILMYIYTGLNSIPEFAFQYIEAMSPDNKARGVSILILPEYYFNLNVGIFDLSLLFIVSMFFFAYFLFVLFNNSSLLTGLPKPLIILFALSFVPTLFGFFIAASKGVNGSMMALRCLFGLSVMFFGYSYALLKKRDIRRVFYLLTRNYIYVLAFLLIVGLMYNHILFIYLGVAAAVAVYVLLFEKNKIKFTLLLISIFMGSFNNTFTIMLIPLVSGLVTFLSFTLLSYKVRDMLPKIGFIFYILFLGFIISVPKQQIKLQDKTTLDGRLYNKIYGDRFFVWTSYLEEIKKANPFFVVPKETIKLETVNKTEKDISFGAHNSLIQLLYYYGVIYGSILFIILFMSLIKCWFIQNIYPNIFKL
ncbi:MAG: hypothetical protein WCX31_02520 [Salinivirgaceae bacterium]